MNDALRSLLSALCRLGASDAHVSTDGTCVVRVQGALLAPDVTLDPGAVVQAVLSRFDSQRREHFEDHGDADLGITEEGERFRIHAYRHGGQTALAIRHLPLRIPTPDELGIPEVIRSWATHVTGLVIVTGPTGSGKSTTLASLANQIHQTQARHIVTIEDPVEYHFPAGQSFINHREIGNDSSGFARAVRAGLREDVDVMVIGEMRDADTIEAALSVAETGHLVFATLHTHSAAQAVDRLVDAFPSDQQSLARSRLSSCLLGVVYQRLVPGVDGRRLAAFEVLTGTPAVRNLIREGKTHHIGNVIETSRGLGMQSMAHGLEALAADGRIELGVVHEFLASNV